MYHEFSLLRRRDVEAITTLSRSEIYRRMADGTFPRPVRIGVNMVRWKMKDVTEWLIHANDNVNAENPSESRPEAQLRRAKR